MDLSWIFESIVNWVASIVTSIMDAVSGIFLNALGTDMTAMEQYFPFRNRGILHISVHSMGAAVLNNGLAAISRVRRARDRSGKPMAAPGSKRYLRYIDRLC